MPKGPADIITFDTPGLGDRSYLITDGAVAAVIDPQRDIDRFLAAAEERGVQIVCVAETHVHNDYLTGGVELARRTGAAYLVPAESGVQAAHRSGADGDEWGLGELTLRPVCTPGHARHHTAYVLLAEGRPAAVFTGGSLLYGTVGRTDLVDPSLTEQLARDQHASARRLLRELPPDTVVYPTHGFGSHCSATVSDLRSGTIGEEQARNQAAVLDEEPFVAQLLAGFTPYPRYYAHMAALNRAGPAPLDHRRPPDLDGAALERWRQDGRWLVDLRPRRVFAQGHLPGAVNVELQDNLATYIGWVLPWGAQLALLADHPDDIGAAQLMLARIGFDQLAGAATTGWQADATERVRIADFASLVGERARRDDVVIVDVRGETEYAAGHLPGAVHIPYYELADRLDQLPAGQPWVHCASGTRAAIAASLLARAGHPAVLVDDVYRTD